MANGRQRGQIGRGKSGDNGTDFRAEVEENMADALERREDLLIQQQSHQSASPAPEDVYQAVDVGKFIVPEEHSWAAHAALVEDKRNGLAFDPARYPLFDGIIAAKFGNPALYNPSHPDYEHFENLRTNLAVLRNDIIGIYLGDGSRMERSVAPVIRDIAEVLAEGLASDKRITVRAANAEAVGAAEMYKYLQGMQDQPGFFKPMRLNLKSLLGLPIHDWNLPPIEATPFSPAGLMAPPPAAADCGCATNPLSFVERYAKGNGAGVSLNM